MELDLRHYNFSVDCAKRFDLARAFCASHEAIRASAKSVGRYNRSTLSLPCSAPCLRPYQLANKLKQRKRRLVSTNWNSGLIYWKDHTPSAALRYSLAHLHPFVQAIELPAADRHPARSIGLYVSFGLHTFTRAVEPTDRDHELYGDNREVRAFCPRRYKRSLELPDIIRTLQRRRCEFARGMNGRVNYVTVEMADGACYAAFFDLRRLKKVGPDAVHLMVQSAYVLDPGKPAPGKGRIHFHALLGHTLRGTTPRPPP